jgi:hypothetical protein
MITYLSEKIRHIPIPVLVYSLLALLVLAPLLLPGYIFFLDMVFVPHLPTPTDINNVFLFKTILHLLNIILPSQVIQKLILFSILILSGFGMHRLLQTINDDFNKTKDFNLHALPYFLAGIFFMVNPFTYSRFMVGHFYVLLGYAFLPWFLIAFLKLMNELNLRGAIRLAIWALSISLVSLHILGMALITAALGLLMASLRLYKASNYIMLKHLLKWYSVAAIIFLIVSSFWLVPAILGKSSTNELISNFDERHLLSFRTVGSDWGVPLNVLSLNGFWGDNQGFYLLPKDVLPVWPILFMLLIIVLMIGAIKAYSTNKYATLLFLTVLFIAWVLSQGVVQSPYAGLNHWLFANVPFFAGYREPGKFIALIALAESYLLFFGVTVLLEKFKQKKIKISSWIIGLIVTLPLVYTPSMLWGFGGQVHAVNYPAQWQQVNEYLKKNAKGKVLFLPWHEYLRLSFADRVVANPASRFFDAQIIQGDNSEIGLIKRQSDNTQSEFIENEIINKNNEKNIAEMLKKIGVEYVLLVKESDYKNYSFLDNQSNLKIMQHNDALKLYKVTK